MSDDAVSILSKISGIAGRKGVVIQSIISAIILLVVHIIQVSDTNSTNNVIITLSNVFTFYTVANIFALAYLVVKQPFITPEVKTVRCHFCDEVMTTATLICGNCSSTSNKGK